MSKRIVILGGGYGGVLTAKKLEKQIRKRKLKDVTLTLIDKNPYHTMLTELHEVAAGRVEEDSIRIDLHKIFARRNVEIVLDEIISADFEKNTLTGKRGEYPYDYLVVGSGCKPAYYGVEGAEDMAFSLWSYEDAIRIREHVQDMFRNALNEADLEKRKEMLTFVVSGAGFTGVEMAGELAEWVPVLCERFGVDREEPRIIICDMLPEILMSLPEKQINKARKRLEKMGVGILTGESMTRITNDSAFLETTGRIGTRTVIWTCGVVGSDIVKSMDLKKQARDRVIVNAHLQSPDYKNVYVVGDNMFYIPEGE
ncbi:MAG: NAD(P)/FAD-dependent oxidoreductase [Clostridia bacterium]